jgi:hypothetical protein
MRTLIHNSDLKRLFTGAGVAVVAGLLMGGAVQPRLGDGIKAPQQEMAGGGTRTYAIGGDTGVGGYPGQVPDYVIGTNYLNPPVVETQVLAYEERAEPTTAYDAAEYAQTTEAVAPTRWEDEPREQPLYPSEQGNAFNPSDLPPPPEPPVDVFEPA